MTESGFRFYAAHRESPEILNSTQWHWGWVAVDIGNDLAVGVITTSIEYEDRSESDAFTDVIVQILYCEYAPLGHTLAIHAKNETAALGKRLYRSGVATEKGEAACKAAGLSVWRPPTKRGPLPRKELSDAKAREIGRSKLILAAQDLQIAPIPPRSERHAER